jgi:AraC-like DNA-binding protein
MEVLYLIPAVQALYSAFTLPFNNRFQAHIIWLFLALLSVAGYFTTMYVNTVFLNTIELKTVAALFLLFTGPFLYLHVVSYIRHYRKPHFVIDLLVIVALVIVLLIWQPDDSVLVMVVANSVLLLYMFWIALLHKKYYKAVKNTWPVPDKFIWQWFPVLIVVFGGFSVLMLMVGLLYKAYIIKPDSDFFTLVAGFAAVGLFYLGYLALRRQDNLLVNPDLDRNEQQVPGLSVEAVHQFMKDSKAYTDNMLSIHKLAQMMGVDEIQLSVVLNKKMNKNFSSFVNEYRIAEVKSRLESGDTNYFTLLAIAFDSGFNSKATFNRVFKSFTGETPREYAKRYAQRK